MGTRVTKALREYIKYHEITQEEAEIINGWIGFYENLAHVNSIHLKNADSDQDYSEQDMLELEFARTNANSAIGDMQTDHGTSQCSLCKEKVLKSLGWSLEIKERKSESNPNRINVFMQWVPPD